MKANLIRWAVVGLMLLSLTVMVSSPALAEVTPLPLDQTVPGAPAAKDGWLSENEYKDESIHMVMEVVNFKPESSKAAVDCHTVRVKIADPSQIRTYMSHGNYDKRGYEEGDALARRVNAIAAVNGDFFKYFYKVGYVTRQGVHYRDALNGTRDVLVIDNMGDFHNVHVPDSKKMADFLANEFPQDRQVVNTFTFGPMLVKDGQSQDIAAYFKVAKSEFEWPYPTQRVAIVQIDTLEYAIVECGGGDGKGMTMQEFADYIAQMFPTCRMAYNLDGGGSTHVVINGKRVNKAPGHRPISDILYFASAAAEGTEE